MCAGAIVIKCTMEAWVAGSKVTSSRQAAEDKFARLNELVTAHVCGRSFDGDRVASATACVMARVAGSSAAAERLQRGPPRL